MHAALDGKNWKAALEKHASYIDPLVVMGVLCAYQEKGYTYLRDGGDRWGVGAAAREWAHIYGITYKTPLAPLCKKGHYGAFIGKTFETMQEYAQLVAEHRKKKADFIKIMISGLMDFDQFGVLTEEGLTPEEIREMIHIAHEEGFSVMVHANGAGVIRAAAEAGVDSVEHGAYPDTDALQAMVENRVIWVPTISTIGNLRGKGRFDENAVRAIFDRTVENVRLFHKMGGIVAPGTDGGAWAVEHGCATEEGYLKQAGVGPAACARGLRAVMERF